MRHLKTGDLLETIETDGFARVLDVSPDGSSWLYVDGHDGWSTLWVLSDDGPRCIDERPSCRYYAFNADASRVLFATEGQAGWYDLDTGETYQADVELHDLHHILAPSPDNTRLAFAGRYANDYVLDGETMQIECDLPDHLGTVWSAWWTPDGRLVTASQDGTIRIRNADTFQTEHVWSTGKPEEATGTLALDPTGTMLVHASTRVRLYPMNDPSVWSDHTSFVYGLEFSPDSRWLISGGFADGVLRRWDVRTGACHRLPGLDAEASREPYMAFTRDGTHLVAASGTTVMEWPVGTWERNDLGSTNPDTRPFETMTDRIGYRPTVRHIDKRNWTDLIRAIYFAEQGVVKLYGGASVTALPDIDPVDEITSLPVPDGTHCVALHPDGTRLATGGRDKTIRIWDIQTHEQVLILRGHTEYVSDVEFSPDGSMLASASGDRTVRIWDTKTPSERRRPPRQVSTSD